MLKMYIDGEQVVSNNNFQIKEEILSPSSAILNNVYPLSWEDDKDYTSRFYYPKDYSSFILENYTHIPPESGLTTKITNNATIQNVDTTKEQEVTQLDGNTEQTTISGKNLFNPQKAVEDSNNAETYITSDGQWIRFKTGGDRLLYYPTNVKENTRYTIEATFKSGTADANSFGWYAFYTDGTNEAVIVYATNDTNEHHTIGHTQPNKTLAYLRSAWSYGKEMFLKINGTQMLEGIYYVENIPSWTPYTGGIPSPNPTYPQNINVVTGNQVVDVIGKNIANIETNKPLPLSSNTTIVDFGEDRTMTLTTSFVLDNAIFTNNTGAIIDYQKKDGTHQYRTAGAFRNSSNQPLTKDTLTNGVYYKVENGITFSKIVLYTYVGFTQGTMSVQVEKGNQATSYEEYKGNTYEVNLREIELCKIGNYQDKIFKSGDTWYLHKEIGKVVLDNTIILNYNGTAGMFYAVNQTIIPNYKASTTLLSNYLQYSSTTWVKNCFGITGANAFWLYIENGPTTLANLQTWLSSNNVSVYYVLNNSTDTEITNEELINELESIKLINGYNDVSITSGDLPGSLTIHYNFVTEQHIDDIIFSGMVKNTSDISLNPRYPKYCSLEVLDYKTLLSEGDTLDFVIYNKTILEAINMVVDAISDYGFELGNVNILNGNEIIGTYSTDNKTAYDVLQYLADISGAKWNCRRKDIYTMYIDFYDPTLLPKGKQIDYTTEWACENNLVDLTFNYGTRDYRNKQVILSDEVYADIDYNEDKIADSYTRDFILSNPIGTIKEILVNGERASVATDTEKDIGVYADFYYKIGDNIVSSNDSNQPYEFGNVISITYIPIIKGREVVQNDNEIDRVADQLQVKGTIARYEDRNDETDTNKLLAIGETYLKYKGEAEITLTLKTKDNDIYDVGQMVYFNAPIEDLSKDYLVKSKEIDIIVQDEEPGHIFYTYELSSSFNSERAVNWFDNQRSKTEGNIKEGEYISRNIDISARTQIVWFNCYCEEIEDMTGDNIINAPLDAPIIK